mmetsp:Transcript_16954/g.36895  ORF Transcript_16954/g.36895 Transcript_16954/m.36895 type:complete len:544 (+) Transcript_16954:214-1845(+)
MRFASVAVAFVVAALTTDRSYLYRYDGIVPTCSIGVAQASSSLRLRPGRNGKSNRNNNNKEDRSHGGIIEDRLAVVVEAQRKNQQRKRERAADADDKTGTSTGTERSVEVGEPKPTADPSTFHLEFDRRGDQQQKDHQNHEEEEDEAVIDIIHAQSPRISPHERQQATGNNEGIADDDREDAAVDVLLKQDAMQQQQQPKKTTRKRQRRQLRTHHHRHAATATTTTTATSSTSNQDILLIRGYQTNLCWKVDNGRYAPGTLIVLDDCDGTDPHQHFVRNNYSYDVETGASSWLFRPVGVPDDYTSASGDGSGSASRDGDDTEQSDSDDDEEETASAMLTTAAASSAAAPAHNLYVVGHKYIPNAMEDGGTSTPAQWRMVLDELEYGVTQPLTQVFWTLGANTGSDGASNGGGSIGSNSDGAFGGGEGGADIDLMGMGQHAYSTRLFVTNEGSVAERDAPVVLRTEKKIYEAQRALLLLKRHEKEEDQDQPQQQQLERVYQLNGREEEEVTSTTAATMHTASTSETVHSASVIPGKWSYVYVGR